MKSVRKLLTGTLLAAICLSPTSSRAQGVIYVTTLDYKISSTGGCSLPEAIYSANLDNNVAVDQLIETTPPGSYVQTFEPHYVTTQCAAGSGDDTIVLPTGATFLIGGNANGTIGNNIVTDPDNPTGPTMMPLITSNITIEAAGSTLQLAFQGAYIHCEVRFISTTTPIGCQTRLFTVASSGHLKLNNANIQNFGATGGDGGPGSGGGGMGAGGAIFIRAGVLEVTNSTFSGNIAQGGNGGNLQDPYYPTFTRIAGGGGGMGGFGGEAFCDGYGAGGGGSGGSGGGYVPNDTCVGSGGGTVLNAWQVNLDYMGSKPGFACGGLGAGAPGAGTVDGQDAPCPGGGGGAGRQYLTVSGNGGKGAYGGGGGGGGEGGGNGGDGGFGGGGGGGWTGFFGGTRGGSGGFGGGGGGVQDPHTGSSHPGVGGTFGGNATAFDGGGGAGLGGAIFNDSGTLIVRNSTFNANVAVRGNGGLTGDSAAGNGADAGAAIFSYHGSTTLQNVTIAGNQTTGGGGGVYIYQDPTLQVPTYLYIYNTIIANNGVNLAGPSECVLSGPSITSEGSGNLIVDNGTCPGVVTSADPALHPPNNNGGLTPTMAFAKTSPAFNAADPYHSPNRDQRNIYRPQAGGFDIGAFELCVAANPLFPPCEVPTVTDPDPMYILTMKVAPATGGTTTPAPGIHPVPVNSVALINAIPIPGNSFLGWTGNVGDPTNPSTTVIMNADQTVIANFTNLTTTLAGNITNKTGPINARLWTLSFTNNGPSGAVGVVVPSFALQQTGGATCTPVIAGPLPLQVGDIPGVAQTRSANIRIDFTGCAATARFTATFTYTANYGTVTGSVVRANQFE